MSRSAELDRRAGKAIVRILWTGLAVASPWNLPCPAQTPDREEKSGADPEVSKEEFQIPADEKTAAEVDQLLPKLNAPNYAERQSATDRLKEIGAPAFPKVRSTYVATDELEIRLRVEEIVRSAYMDHHVFSGHPFMGIGLQPAADSAEAKALGITASTPAVRINKVFPDSAAERAGFKEGDILTAQDGVRPRGTGRDLVVSFSQGIARRTPGSRVVLTVMRASGPEDIEITLGRLPAETANAGSFVDLPEKIERAKQQFDPWWNFHFRKPAEKARSANER